MIYHVGVMQNYSVSEAVQMVRLPSSVSGPSGYIAYMFLYLVLEQYQQTCNL